MNSPVIVASIVSAASAFGVGGIAGQLIGAGRERREGVAGLVQALSDVEQYRWAYAVHEEGDNIDFPEFRRKLTRVQTAAVIAAIPRGAIDVYCDLALAARNASWGDAEDSNGQAWDAGSIDPALALVVRQAARSVSVLGTTPRGLRGVRWLTILHPEIRRNLRKVDKPVRESVESSTGFGAI